MAGEVAREETNPKTWTIIGGHGLAPVPGGPSENTVNRRTSCLGSAGRDLCWPSILLLEAPCAMGSPRLALPLHPQGAHRLLASAPDFRGDSNTRACAHLVTGRERQVRTARERRKVAEKVLPSTLGAGGEPALMWGVGWLFSASQIPPAELCWPSARVRAALARVRQQAVRSLLLPLQSLSLLPATQPGRRELPSADLP